MLGLNVLLRSLWPVLLKVGYQIPRLHSLDSISCLFNSPPDTAFHFIPLSFFVTVLFVFLFLHLSSFSVFLSVALDQRLLKKNKCQSPKRTAGGPYLPAPAPIKHWLLDVYKSVFIRHNMFIPSIEKFTLKFNFSKLVHLLYAFAM